MAEVGATSLPEALRSARDTLGGAISAATQLPAAEGSALLRAGREALNTLRSAAA